MRKRKLVPRRTDKRDTKEFQAVPAVWGDFHEAKRLSGLGRSSITELVRLQKIRSSKFGKRRLINLPSLLSYIEARAVGPAAPTKESEQLPAAE
jgi:hypothetical protein